MIYKLILQPVSSNHVCVLIKGLLAVGMMFVVAFYDDVSNSGGKISLGRPRRRWEDNIKMDLQEVGVGSG